MKNVPCGTKKCGEDCWVGKARGAPPIIGEVQKAIEEIIPSLEEKLPEPYVVMGMAATEMGDGIHLPKIWVVSVDIASSPGSRVLEV